MIRFLLVCLCLVGCGAYEQKDCYVYGEDCPAAEKGDTGAPGRPGDPGAGGSVGASGPAGAAGADGTDCEIRQIEGGAVITCGDTMSVIANGHTGSVGPQGADGSNGSSCSVEEVCDTKNRKIGARIFCTDGTEVVLPSQSKSARCAERDDGY
jgi:hypothetical protein